MLHLIEDMVAPNLLSVIQQPWIHTSQKRVARDVHNNHILDDEPKGQIDASISGKALLKDFEGHSMHQHYDVYTIDEFGERHTSCSKHEHK